MIFVLAFSYCIHRFSKLRKVATLLLPLSVEPCTFAETFSTPCEPNTYSSCHHWVSGLPYNLHITWGVLTHFLIISIGLADLFSVFGEVPALPLLIPLEPFIYKEAFSTSSTDTNSSHEWSHVQLMYAALSFLCSLVSDAVRRRREDNCKYGMVTFTLF